jgi:N-acetylglutamate synthase-like GNAT family acetyltransferase
MLDTKPITVQSAIDFTKVHWPPHNQRQGIDWKQQDFALGAYEDGEQVGAAVYKVVGGLAFLEQIVVADDKTDGGIGSALLKAFEAHAAELGCHVLQLETARTQAPAFYERHGYERAATFPNGRFHLEWYVYRKTL